MIISSSHLRLEALYKDFASVKQSFEEQKQNIHDETGKFKIPGLFSY